MTDSPAMSKVRFLCRMCLIRKRATDGWDAAAPFPESGNSRPVWPANYQQSRSTLLAVAKGAAAEVLGTKKALGQAGPPRPQNTQHGYEDNGADGRPDERKALVSKL